MLKTNTSVDSVWLTDPSVPDATPVWATRQTIFRTNRTEAWIPNEPTMWWDFRNNVVYVADGKEVTDFSSTPAGDGQEGVLRGAGRLHDMMNEETPVLIPKSSSAAFELSSRISAARLDGRSLKVEEVLLSGYRRSVKPESVWSAGRLYSRMLRAAGFPVWRAFLQRAGLRTLGLQHVYKKIWVTDTWRNDGPRKL